MRTFAEKVLNARCNTRGHSSDANWPRRGPRLVGARRGSSRQVAVVARPIHMPQDEVSNRARYPEEDVLAHSPMFMRCLETRRVREEFVWAHRSGGVGPALRGAA